MPTMTLLDSSEGHNSLDSGPHNTYALAGFIPEIFHLMNTCILNKFLDPFFAIVYCQVNV
jgi:hypothetical protein